MVELNRLCEALGRTLQDLTTQQRRLWTDALQGMRPEAGTAAITQLIETWSWHGFPPVGALHRVAKEASQEGAPNAGAYGQSAPRELTDEERERNAASVKRQDEWLAMDDSEYFDELMRLQAEGKVGI